MLLDDAINEAQHFFTKEPPNESSTCEWVILPLLWAAGYERWEIVSRVADSNNSYPDYTILPGDPNPTWYLEAKAWKVSLEDPHAHQALNYANQNGKRWVVLTNGRVWRLYDNTIQGLPAAKQIIEVRLSDSLATNEMLTALGKDGVTSRNLEEYARRKTVDKDREQRVERLSQTLGLQLVDIGSTLIAAMCRALHEQPGLNHVSADEVAAYFRHDAIPILPDSSITENLEDESPSRSYATFWKQFRQRLILTGTPTKSHKEPWNHGHFDAIVYDSQRWFRYYVLQESAWVEYCLTAKDSETKQQRFEQLYDHRGTVEAAFGESLVWENKPDTRTAKIRWSVPGGGLQNVDSWSQTQDAMIDAMGRLVKALAQYVEEGT